jgi:hypothetical protein
MVCWRGVGSNRSIAWSTVNGLQVLLYIALSFARLLPTDSSPVTKHP